MPEPATVTLTVALSPAASVPDIGATTTFFSRPGGSETDQFTLPPEAVSVIVPVPGGVMSSVAGPTLSVPAPGGSLVLGLAAAYLLFSFLIVMTWYFPRYAVLIPIDSGGGADFGETGTPFI